jgi:hypothetical protein
MAASIGEQFTRSTIRVKFPMVKIIELNELRYEDG